MPPESGKTSCDRLVIPLLRHEIAPYRKIFPAERLQKTFFSSLLGVSRVTHHLGAFRAKKNEETDTAEMSRAFHREGQAMSGASRARRWRNRQRYGLVIWQVEVPENELVEAFIAAGLVHPDSADTAYYQRAAVAILLQWAEQNSVTRYSRLLALDAKTMP